MKRKKKKKKEKKKKKNLKQKGKEALCLPGIVMLEQPFLSQQ